MSLKFLVKSSYSDSISTDSQRSARIEAVRIAFKNPSEKHTVICKKKNADGSYNIYKETVNPHGR